MDIVQLAQIELQKIQCTAHFETAQEMADMFADPDFMGLDDEDERYEAELRENHFNTAKWNLVKTTLLSVIENMPAGEDRTKLLVLLEITGMIQGE